MKKNYSGHGALALANAVSELYAQGQTDYAMEPIVLVDSQNQPVGRIAEGDAVIFCCRRGEREIQLTEAFVEEEFGHFERKLIENLTFVILTLYHEKFKHLPIAFAPSNIKETLGEIISRENMRQYRVSESEKFTHITFFLNGGSSQPLLGEKDVRIPSAKLVPFEQIPEMSLAQVVEKVISAVKEGYDFIVTNFANGDVIGHTQNRNAKIKCAELIDAHLSQVVNAAVLKDYIILITADHGNLEEMINTDGTHNVSHSTNPVPFILIDPRAEKEIKVQDGTLADIAPTILRALDIPQPIVMDGQCLAAGHHWGGKRQVLLVILDGWGVGKQDETNPIFLAHTPAWDEFIQRYPNAQLKAAGESVGLKSGKAGNSEAGHINIGVGRVVLQDDVRLDLAMKDGSFNTNETFCRVIHDVKKRNSNLHLIGLLTERSSHGSIDYPLALLRMAKENDLKEVYIHLIFDGRSTAPGSAPALLEKLETQVKEIGLGLVVSGIGRGIALDRDGNYAKTKRAYEAFVSGIARMHSKL